MNIYYYYYHFHTFVQCYFASISSRNNYSVLPNRPKFPFANWYLPPHFTISWKSSHDPFERKSKTIKRRPLRKHSLISIANFSHSHVHSNKAISFQRWKITRLTATRLFAAARLQFFSPERDELWTIEFGQYRGWLSICDRQVKLLSDGNSFESKSNRFDCFASRIVLTFLNR